MMEFEIYYQEVCDKLGTIQKPTREQVKEYYDNNQDSWYCAEQLFKQLK